MLIGGPARPLLEVPVGEGRVGAVVIGGLNPLAIFEESGERVLSQALAGLVEFERLFPYYELEDRLKADCVRSAILREIFFQGAPAPWTPSNTPASPAYLISPRYQTFSRHPRESRDLFLFRSSPANPVRIARVAKRAEGRTRRREPPQPV
jgi:hypothetical protein